MLVLANASRHGLPAVLPMVAGAAGGAASVLLLVGTGLAGPLAAHQGVRTLMAAAGLAWLTVLAVQLFRAAPQLPDAGDDGDRRGRLGLIGTAGLQWINPKAWMMALAATGVFAGGGVPMPALAGCSSRWRCPACWCGPGWAPARRAGFAIRRRWAGSIGEWRCCYCSPPGQRFSGNSLEGATPWRGPLES